MSSKKKILIVDDEENILIGLEFILKKEGYEVQKANNGIEAIETYQRFLPEVILLDVMMPEMDGYEAAKKIRQLDERSSVSIIFLTAKGAPQDKASGYKSGADDYIIKPFENAMILEKVSEKFI